MLLRWHVYRPAHISAGARSDTRKLEDIFERARDDNSGIDWKQDPSSWGNEHEEALIRAIGNQAGVEGIMDDSKLDELNNDLKEDRAGPFETDLDGINFDFGYLR